MSIPDMMKRGLKPIAILGASRPHGDRLRYMAGCKCDLCRSANTTYERARQKARAAGDWNGIVPADKARAHMLKLSRKGVGRRAIQAATDIAESVLSAIRSGTKTHIRARTERKILVTTREIASAHSFTCAKKTWALLDKLLEVGYTKTQLAHLLGAKTHALQINKDRVLIDTEAKVVRLFARLERQQFANAKKRAPILDLPRNTYQPRPGVLVHTLD